MFSTVMTWKPVLTTRLMSGLTEWLGLTTRLMSDLTDWLVTWTDYQIDVRAHWMTRTDYQIDVRAHSMTRTDYQIDVRAHWMTRIACPLPYTQDINRSFASCEQNPDAIFMLLLHNTLSILVEVRGALALGLLTLCKREIASFIRHILCYIF